MAKVELDIRRCENCRHFCDPKRNMEDEVIYGFCDCRENAVELDNGNILHTEEKKIVYTFSFCTNHSFPIIENHFQKRLLDIGTCGECVFKGNDSNSEITKLCRRNPPTMIEGNSIASDGFWPSVTDDDWCGEFKRNLQPKNIKQE